MGPQQEVHHFEFKMAILQFPDVVILQTPPRDFIRSTLYCVHLNTELGHIKSQRFWALVAGGVCDSTICHENLISSHSHIMNDIHQSDNWKRSAKLDRSMLWRTPGSDGHLIAAWSFNFFCFLWMN